MKKKKRAKPKRTYKRKKKFSKSSQSGSNIIKFLFLLAAVAFVVYYSFFRPSSKGKTTIFSTQEKKVDLSSLPKTEAIDYSLNEVFTKYNLLESWISKQNKLYKVRVPQEVPAILLIHEIINKMENLDYAVLSSRENLTTNQATIEIGYKNKLIRKLIVSQEPDLKIVQGRIAIIIDDFGYDESEDIQKILRFPHQIAISIIPGLPKSITLYQQAQQYNKETLIHLPMEAIEDKVDYTDYTIYASNMTDQEIRNRVKKAIEDYPESKGLNNHMGSKVTSDSRIMELVMQELKKSKLYFIDSKTTSKSVAYQIAKKFNIPSSKRDIFLDSGRDDDENYLRKKLIAITKIIKKKGSVIAIGHPYKNTIKVLMEEIPKLEKQGYVFVPVSELVN